MGAAPKLSLREGLAALPRPVWVLFAGTFLNKFGTFVIPFLSLYLTQRGFSTAQAGLAIAAYGVGNCLAAGVGGHLADSLGRRRTIVLSMLGGAASMLLLSQARTLPWIVVLVGLAGLAGEFYRPASSALLADLVPPAQRVTAYSAYRLAFNAGWAFGPATAGFLAGHSFFWLFAGDAATSLLFAGVAWVALPEGVRAPRTEAGWGPALAVIRRDRRMWRVLGATLAVGVVFQQMASTFSLHVTNLGYSAAVYGALISSNGVLVVLCELPLTTWSRRFPPRRVMALGYSLVGGGFAVLAGAHGVPALAAGIAVFTFGEMLAAPTASAYVANLAPPALRGRYSGAVGFANAFALMGGPALGLALVVQHAVWVWLGCGVLGLLAAGLILGGED